ncbi:SAM-dependent methyltransferase [Rhodobacteraceae bacterium]|nr:SAM-dependent methyltransferase [Paracoccaceae bacterium]
MNGAPKLTDRKALALHRIRAAKAPVTFLHDAIADEVKERLNEVNKTFTSPLLIGNVTPPLAAIFPDAPQIDDTPELTKTSGHDLTIHCFGIHWADDPIGQMVQSRLALKPDGLFLGVMFGGASLQELRICLAEAEAKLTGGLSPRVLPMADLRDLGGLLQRAGLALPVADARSFTVRYPSLAKLVHDLRGMGETNALATRNLKPVSRQLFRETEAIYRKNFNDDGFLVATFDIVFLTGWAPSEIQQKPLRPGSAQSRLSEALGVPEKSLKR